MEARQLELEEAAAVRSSPSGNSFATEEQANCPEKRLGDESHLEMIGIHPRLSITSNNIQSVSRQRYSTFVCNLLELTMSYVFCLTGNK
jgi:hypothetical protein